MLNLFRRIKLLNKLEDYRHEKLIMEVEKLEMEKRMQDMGRWIGL